jgi:MFS family permease
MVGGLSVTELVSWGVLIYAFSVLVVPMHAQLGWSPAVLNGAYTTALALYGAVAIPVGRWLQRHGSRGLMTAGSVLAVAALLGWSQARSLPELYACFVIAGPAMAATLYEPAFAVTAAWFTRRRPQAVLVVTIAGGLSSAVFIPAIGALVTGLGWRHALIALAVIVAVVTVPIHAVLLRRRPADLGLHPDGDNPSPASPSSPGQATPAQETPASTPRAGKAVLRRASFRWITASMVTSTASRFAVVVILVAYLTGRGYPLAQATLAAGGLGLFQVIGRIGSTWLRPRVPEHRTAIVLFTVQGLALPAPLLTGGHGTAATVSVIVLVVGYGLGSGLASLLRGTLIADYYGPGVYAGVNGVVSAFVVAAQAAGPLLAGLAVTAFGTSTPVLAGGAVLALGSAFSLSRAHHAHASEQQVTA